MEMTRYRDLRNLSAIETEEQYEESLKRSYELMDVALHSQASEEFENLIRLIMDYESKHYPIEI